jgi:hypothetical protein
VSPTSVVAVSTSSHPASRTIVQFKNCWPCCPLAAACPAVPFAAAGVEATHVKAVTLSAPEAVEPHLAALRSVDVTLVGRVTVHMEGAGDRQPPPRMSPVRLDTPYPPPAVPLSSSSAASASATTLRLHDGGRETRKVDEVELNERIGYGAAAVLCGRSGVEVVLLQLRRMGQSPEKPKGYGAELPPHRWSHRPPPAAAVAEKVALGR